MRSYRYSQGKWQLSKDTLPPTMLDPFTHIQSPLFQKAVEKLGFSLSEKSTYTCRFGPLVVLARDHEAPPTIRKSEEASDFLCILRISGSYIRIWIADMQELMHFFLEVDAGPEDKKLEKMIDYSSLTSMINNIAILADRLSDGYGELNVILKSPGQPSPEASLERAK